MVYLGCTKGGEKVYDRPDSHNKLTKGLLKEVLYKIKGAGKHTVDLGRIVGLNPCVRTGVDAEVVYKQRKGRAGLTRFVKLDPEPTSLVTVILARKPYGFMLITSWYGGSAEPETWDEAAFERDPRGYDAAKAASVHFWANHALVK